MGDVYVSEYDNNRVQKFSSNGTWLGRIGVTGVPYVPDTTRYNTPYGITVAADGSIYVVESWGSRLVKLNAGGVQQWAVGQAGVFGGDNAHFRNAWWAGVAGNVADDTAGRVYVPDTGDDRIQIFDAGSGAFIATWHAVATGGFGDGENRTAGGLAVFDGALYVGASNQTTGEQLWRSSNGTDWTLAALPGFGDHNNYKPDGLIVFQGNLCVFTSNDATGSEVWRSADGTGWTQVNPDGFGDSSNRFILWSSGLAVFDNSLHVGVYADGSAGKVWRMLTPTYLPLLLR
jgi:hypothetical protein